MSDPKNVIVTRALLLPQAQIVQTVGYLWSDRHGTSPVTTLCEAMRLTPSGKSLFRRQSEFPKCGVSIIAQPSRRLLPTFVRDPRRVGHYIIEVLIMA